MRALEFITGHVIYNPAYTYKFQLKTTKVFRDRRLRDQVEYLASQHLKDLIVGKVVPDVHNLFPISERFRNFQASSSALHPPLLLLLLLLLHSELFFTWFYWAINLSIKFLWNFQSLEDWKKIIFSSKESRFRIIDQEELPI